MFLAVDKMKDKIWNTSSTSQQQRSPQRQRPKSQGVQNQSGSQNTTEQTSANTRKQQSKPLPLHRPQAKQQQLHQPQRQRQQQKPQATAASKKNLTPVSGQNVQESKQVQELEKLVNAPQMLMMQQSAVHRFKRSIFNLPPPQPVRVPIGQTGAPEATQDQAQIATKASGSSEEVTDLSKSFDATALETKATDSKNSIDNASANVTDSAGVKDEPNSGTNNEDLVRMSGFFLCKNCKAKWRSINVYCKPGTKKAEYGQLCNSCRTMCMPRRVEKLKCVTCGRKDCDCETKTLPFTEPKLAHRRDLCGKCLTGNLCA